MGKAVPFGVYDLGATRYPRRFPRLPSFQYLNRSPPTFGLVPPGVLSVTSTVPLPFGETIVSLDAETTSSLVPGVLAKSTTLAPSSPVPVTVTGYR